MAKRKVCGARHPMYPAQVRCGSDANHVSAEHFNSFYMRSWDDDDAGLGSFVSKYPAVRGKG